MTVQTLSDVANALVDFCRSGQEETALTTLYAEDATSTEAAAE